MFPASLGPAVQSLRVTHPSIPTAPAGARPLVSRARARSRLFARPEAPLAAALLVTVLALVAITQARSAGYVAALWAAGAVAITIWLRAGSDRVYDLAFAGLITVGFAAGNLLAGNPPMLAVMFTTANMIEVIAAVMLVRRFAPGPDLRTVEGLSRFLAAAAVVAPLPAAVFAAACLAAIGNTDFLSAVQTWWFGHALGIAAIAPVGLAARTLDLRLLRHPLRLLEGTILLGAIVAASLWVFTQDAAPLAFLLTPLLIVAAARMRVVGASLAILIVTLVAVGGTLAGHGPMALATSLGRPDQVILAQLFVLMGCLPALVVAALLEERDAFARQAQSSLRRAERASAAKSRLLANVAHEIKSPIGGIIGIGELWSGGKLGPVSQTQAEMSDMLVRTARQVETLAHDLLDVARAESGSVRVSITPVDVGALFEDLRRAARMGAGEACPDIVLALPPEPVRVSADSVRLHQVLSNLLTNAIKYAGSHGPITLGATVSDDETRVRLFVRDHGPGISAEKQELLFEPFNRLGMEKSSIEGHGVGLALAKRLTELQGGQITVTSREGEGATFTVELPLA